MVTSSTGAGWSLPTLGRAGSASGLDTSALETVGVAPSGISRLKQKFHAHFNSDQNWRRKKA